MRLPWRASAGISKSYIVHPTSYIGGVSRSRPFLATPAHGFITSPCSCSASRASSGISKSYIVHRTSYIGGVSRPRPFLATPAYGFITSPCSRSASRATRANFQIDSPPPHRWFALRAAHARCPYALTAVVRVVHRTSYLVHRRRQPPSSLSSHSRSQFHHVPLASAPLPRAAGARTLQIVHRTSYLVHRQTHF